MMFSRHAVSDLIFSRLRFTAAGGDGYVCSQSQLARLDGLLSTFGRPFHLVLSPCRRRPVAVRNEKSDAVSKAFHTDRLWGHRGPIPSPADAMVSCSDPGALSQAHLLPVAAAECW
jgi:hypothetical protein